MVAASLDTLPRSLLPVPMLSGGIPLLGHMKEMQRDPLALVSRVRDELGDVGAIRLGTEKVIVVSEPAAIERVLVDNVKSYSKQTRGYEQLRKMLGNGLVTSEGSFWLRQRRIAQPAFHREKIGNLARIMQRDSDEALARFPRGQPFDFSNEMMKLTMRIIGEALFSVDVSGDSDAAGNAINELVHQAFMRTVSLTLPLAVPTPANRRFKKAKRDLDDVVLGIIAARRSGESSGEDLLQMLLDTVDEETGERMDDAQLRDEALTLFSAGHETTSMLVSWTLNALLDHPEVEAKLRAELASAEPVARLPYLDAVLKESMRVHPPIWLVARCAEGDDELCGHRVEKGDLLFVSQWVMHRHPRYWPEPLRFDPARFLVDDPARPKYAYFPFLGGPRKCIGDQLAILEAKIILSTLLRALRFERVEGRPVVPDPAVSLRFKNGLWVRAHTI